MKSTNSASANLVALLCLLAIGAPSRTVTVGVHGEYQTISAAISSLPAELVEDIIIAVDIDPIGYTEPDFEADIADFVLNGYSLEIQADFYNTVTVYVDGEIEYRIDNEQNVETIHNIIAGELLARRSLDQGSVTAPRDYFVKNHLGSTVATVADAGNVTGDVLDYYAYGKQVRVIIYAGSDATETFAGKELDRFDDDIALNGDGEGLYYFGARYYDPEVALWTVVDPVGQFWSPYSYTGNGVNPIIGVDLDGMNIIFYKDCSEDFIRDFYAANEKLVSLGITHIEEIRNDPNVTIMVMEVTNMKDPNGYTPHVGGVLQWHSNRADRTQSGEVISSLTQLSHEGGHAYDDKYAKVEHYVWKDFLAKIPFIGNGAKMELENSAMKYERAAAEALGETPRKDYYDILPLKMGRHLEKE
jgi:RHS repeat-associated protein